MIVIIVMIIFTLYDHFDLFGYHDHNEDNQECKHIAGDVERHEKHMKESRHVHTFRSKAYRCEVSNNGNDDGGDVVVGRLLDWSCAKEASHFNDHSNFQRAQKARYVVENLVFCARSCGRRGGTYMKHPPKVMM